MECFCSPLLNLKWAISSTFGLVFVLAIAATHHQWRSFYTEEGDIRYSKNTAVYWQGGATFSAGAERCSALTITWLKVTENNNDRDEAEAITFGGEPAKTVMPIPFTKELSSCQMMRITGFHFPFFPCRCFTELFLYLKAYLLQSLNSCRNLFSLVEMALTACSTLEECSILCRRDIHEKYSVKSALALHGSHEKSRVYQESFV